MAEGRPWEKGHGETCKIRWCSPRCPDGRALVVAGGGDFQVGWMYKQSPGGLRDKPCSQQVRGGTVRTGACSEWEGPCSGLWATNIGRKAKTPDFRVSNIISGNRRDWAPDKEIGKQVFGGQSRSQVRDGEPPHSDTLSGQEGTPEIPFRR